MVEKAALQLDAYNHKYNNGHYLIHLHLTYHHNTLNR